MSAARYIAGALVMASGLYTAACEPRKPRSECNHDSNLSILDRVRVGMPFAEILAILPKYTDNVVLGGPDNKGGSVVSTRFPEAAGDGRNTRLLIASRKGLSGIVVEEIEILELDFDADAHLTKKVCSVAYTGP